MPPSFSQAGRILSLTTPLGADKLLLERIDGTEGVSELFRYSMGVLVLKSDAFAFDTLLGQAVTAKVMLADGSSRFLSGIVAEVEEADALEGIGETVPFVRYRLTVVPKLWLSTLGRNTRAFQQMAVPDILKQVLTGIDASWQLQGTYKPRDYVTQYRESDLAFASRLMEEEGIFYFFQHSDGSHKLVVSDNAQAHQPLAPATIPFRPGEGGGRPEDRITRWARRQQVRAGKVTLWDQCFELPGQNLEATQSVLATVATGTVTQKLDAATNSAFEQYDYPGGYAQRFDGTAPGGADRASDVQNIFQDNARTVGIRMQQETARALVIDGEAQVRHLCAGYKFTLAGHFNADGDYVLTRLTFSASIEGAYTGQKSDDWSYSSTFECIPAALPFRPERKTPRPTIPGPQTAVVVGPSGEEIFTDKYGRVKVQFPWDRQGQKDAASSCWVRVGTPWAGKQWGMIQIPRIGHEVVVAFEDGDPDRPLIVGCVFNAENMPPYTLPDNKTRSTLKTRSSLNGEADNFNELRFEDKKDSEEIYFHAEKDFNRVVENNDTLKVGFEKKDKGDQTVEIFNNQSVKVGAGAGNAEDGSQTVDVYKNRSTTLQTGDDTLVVKKGKRSVEITEGDDLYVVKKGKRQVEITTGDDLHTVKTGNRTVEISTGNEALTVKTGNREVSVDTGNDTLTVKTGNHTITVSAGKCSIEAATAIELTCGGSSIKIEPSAITIKAPTVKVQADAQATVQSPMTQVSGDGMLELKGGLVKIN